jgi:hypothetical protein
MNLNELVSNVTLTKACSIKPDGTSDEHKLINLKVKFDGATLQGVFDKALAGVVIQWQNGPGRKGFDKWSNNQTVEISFTSPGRTTIDPMQVLIAEAEGLGIEVEELVRVKLEALKK